MSDRSGRSLVTEFWYPAASRLRGADLDPASRDAFTAAEGLPRLAQDAVRDSEPAHGHAPLPLVLYFHGGYGHRREATHLCTHLASHGYAVAAPDFPGDNVVDNLPQSMGGSARSANVPIDESAANRPAQAVATAEGILDAARTLGITLDATRIGTMGVSMGGFTALATNSLDRRFVASFAICPMYGQRSPTPQVRRLQSLLRLDGWSQRPAVFLLAGEVDPIVILADLRELHDRLPPPKRLAVLGRAGHMHFVDGAAYVHELMRKSYLSGEHPDPEIDALALGEAMRPMAELCSESKSTATARALCLAHMDAVLRRHAAAAAFLDAGLAERFAARGIALEVAAATQ
ncbi:MAG TPA: dienelactone hydrolase family protein [Steroidobacteraceae bacterium]|nr:dienelactone hydrolase family protein [Steroidobacteraceae bacterium]